MSTQTEKKTTGAESAGPIDAALSQSPELSPFQKRGIDRTDDRIILQPRRTGSSYMQAILARDRVDGRTQVVVVLPNQTVRDIWLRDYGAASDPNLITMSAKAGIDEARSPDVVIVDQPQHISARVYYQMVDNWPEDAEWVFAATGGSGAGESPSALDRAVESGRFSLMWADLVEDIYQLHNDPENVASFFESMK